MYKTTLKIDGMMCGMCESHINDTIRKAAPVEKVTSSHAKGEAVVLTDEPLAPGEIADMIAGAHDEGFSVMAHANGDSAVRAALAAGVDSIEHGAYLSPETRSQLAESHAVWVPTLVTIGNLIGDGRFPDAALRPLLAFQQQAVRDAAAQGARIACGSDAGAYRVLHAQGGLDEQALLRRTLGPNADQILTQGNTEIQKRF